MVVGVTSSHIGRYIVHSRSVPGRGITYKYCYIGTSKGLQEIAGSHQKKDGVGGWRDTEHHLAGQH